MVLLMLLAYVNTVDVDVCTILLYLSVALFCGCMHVLVLVSCAFLHFGKLIYSLEFLDNIMPQINLSRK